MVVSARGKQRLGSGFRPSRRRLSQEQVLVDADQAELQQLVARESHRSGRVIDDLRVNQRVVATLVRGDAPPGRADVQVPGRVLAEGSRHNKRVAERAHAERGRMDAARYAAAVVQHAEYRHPPPPGDQKDQWVDQTGRKTDNAASPRPETDSVGALVHSITS